MVIGVSILTLLIVGMAIHAALRLVYGTRGPSADDLIYVTLHAAGWFLIGLSAITFCIFGLGFLGLILGLASVVCVGLAWSKHLEVQRQLFASLLSVVVDKQINLPAALNQVAEHDPGILGKWARQLAQRVGAGTPVPAAIDEAWRSFPHFTSALARVGAATGSMGSALREAVTAATAHQALGQVASNRLLYLLLIVFIGQCVFTFMMIKIVPTFEMILDDFGMELPALTSAVILGSRYFVDYALLPAIVGSGLVMAGLVYCVLWMAFQLRWIRRLPLDSWHHRSAQRAILLRSLALAAERELPLVQTFTALAVGHRADAIGRRLSSVVHDVEQGMNWCESLYEQRLISRLDLAVLQSAERLGNLPWALRTLADRGVRRYGHWLEAMVQVAFPCFIVFLGLLVLMFVVGMFMPITQMIHNMT